MGRRHKQWSEKTATLSSPGVFMYPTRPDPTAPQPSRPDVILKFCVYFTFNYEVVVSSVSSCSFYYSLAFRITWIIKVNNIIQVLKINIIHM